MASVEETATGLSDQQASVLELAATPIGIGLPFASTLPPGLVRRRALHGGFSTRYMITKRGREVLARRGE
jgi:ribosomal protein L34